MNNISSEKDSPNSLKLGFIGGGMSSAIGPSHFAACELDRRWSVVSGAFSSDKRVNLSTAKNWQIAEERVFSHWQDMIKYEANKIDAVAVLLPTPDHCDVILELVRKGLPVICEKPLVEKLGDATKIKAEIDKTNGFLAVTYNYSAYPMIRELKERIKIGDLGKIKKIKIEMPQEVFLRKNPETGEQLVTQGWRLRDGEIPTICHDLGAHLYHLTRFLMGKIPLRVAGRFSNHSNYQGLVDDIVMWVDFEDGLAADFWMSKSALGNRNGLKLRIFGSEASAEWIQTEPEYLMMAYANGERFVIDRGSKLIIAGENRYNRYKAGHPAGFIEAFANLYYDIADSLIEYRKNGSCNNQFVFGIEHSLESLNLFDGLVKANKSGSWVEL